jgi:hypothetical protein
MATMEDIQELFASMTPAQQGYVLDNVQSVPELYLYYTSHWFHGTEPESLNRQRAIDGVAQLYRAIIDNTYGLRD